MFLQEGLAPIINLMNNVRLSSFGCLYLAYILLVLYHCSVSSLAWFMSNQETSFVTLAQRVLANPLK